MGFPFGGCCRLLVTGCLDRLNLILNQAKSCHIPLELGQRVFAGTGSSSGVYRPSRCSMALRWVGLKPRMPSRLSLPFIFIRLMILVRSSTKV